jgi:hypothetical protein
MTFSPVYTLESKTCPGVTVTLRRMGPKRRAELELKTATARAQCRQALAESEKLDAQVQSALDAVPGFRDAVAALPEAERSALTPAIIGMIPDEVWTISALNSDAKARASAVERAEIQPAMVISAVQSIAGIDSYTAEMLCDAGPDELFAEVVVAINENAYLGREKAANLSLPTTPGEQGSGTATISTADDASQAAISTGS